MKAKLRIGLILVVGLIILGSMFLMEEDNELTKETSENVNGELTAHFIDVGQGDAIFLETPCDSHVLVDAGENWEGETVVNYIKDLGINEIDKVVASHPHSDHIGGLSDVYEQLDVNVTYGSGYEHDTETFEEYYELATENSRFEIATKGDELDIDCLDAKFLHPPENHTGEVHDVNLVLNVDFHGNSLLLTGDAEIPSEELMIQNNSEYLSSDILKVGHHGSSTSTGEEFLNEVSPEVAVIQVGVDNRYDHPHPEVLKRLKENNIEIYRNDAQGDIVITIDENGYSTNVEPWEGEVGEVEKQIDEVNLNTASKEKLQEITHISTERAREIKELRPFDTLEQLTEIDGIAEGILEEIQKENIAYVE
ncbi:MBL fold metallo-hydrolase [Natranaerobius trueperi]|nr:MBL fold metallo-hydrolase [Natranaerobius trueperi]